MPCNDVTEFIRILLDDDRLTEYALRKQTCGRAVGTDSLLLADLANARVDDILTLDPPAFLDRFPEDSDTESFLRAKHLLALQSALAVYVGSDAGGPDAACSAVEFAYEDERTVIEALLKVDLLTERIPPCGPRGCKDCRPPEN